MSVEEIDEKKKKRIHEGLGSNHIHTHTHRTINTSIYGCFTCEIALNTSEHEKHDTSQNCPMFVLYVHCFRNAMGKIDRLFGRK